MSSTDDITKAELVGLLAAIDCGDVVLEVEGETPAEVYAGDVTYRASNGWIVVVFNDCGEWDYLDSVVAPDGRMVEYPAHGRPPSAIERVVMAYDPSAAVIAERYAWGNGGRRGRSVGETDKP